MQKISTSIDLVLIYLHYESEMNHRTRVFAVHKGRVPEFIVECLPSAESFADGAAYDEDRFLIMKQSTRSGALLGSVKIPRLTVVRVNGGKVEGDSRPEHPATSHDASDPRWGIDFRHYALDRSGAVARETTAVASELLNQEQHDVVLAVLDIHTVISRLHGVVISDRRLLFGDSRRMARLIIYSLWRGTRPRLGMFYAQIRRRLRRRGLGGPGLSSSLILVLDDIGQGPVDSLLNFVESGLAGWVFG